MALLKEEEVMALNIEESDEESEDDDDENQEEEEEDDNLNINEDVHRENEDDETDEVNLGPLADCSTILSNYMYLSSENLELIQQLLTVNIFSNCLSTVLLMEKLEERLNMIV